MSVPTLTATPPLPAARRHVHVVGPHAAGDLTLPGDRTLADLVPEIVDLLGPGPAGTGPGTAWVLRRPTGALLPGNLDVAAAGLVDGDTLRLEYWDPGLPEPVVEDVPAELAAATAGLPDPLPPRVLLPAWGVVLAWAIAAWLLVVRAGVVTAPGSAPGRLAASAAALAVAITVGTAVRTWRHRGDDPAPRASAEVLAALPLWALVGLLPTIGGAVPSAVAVGAATLGGGAVALLVATRGRSPVALAAAAVAGPWALVAGIGVGLDAPLVEIAAVVAGLVAVLLPAAPIVVGWGLPLTTDPSRTEVIGAATATVDRVVAVRAGCVLAVLVTWPVLLPAGGAATVLGLLSAAALALGAVRRGVGTDTAVTALASLAGLTALVATATVALTAELGPAVGVLCPVVLVAVVGRAVRIRPGRRAAVVHRLGWVQIAVHAALPAVMVAALGGYALVRALAEGVS